MELEFECVFRFRRDHFVIAYPYTEGKTAKPGSLVLEEIVPGPCFINIAGQGVALILSGERHVLINLVDGAQVAQMPEEAGSELCAVGGDGGHDDVSAVA